MLNKELQDKVNQWFQSNWEHYRSEVSKNISWGEMSEYTDDLCIECYESFMNKSQEQILQMYEDSKILNYLLYCSSFQIRSSTSPFYNKYRKHRAKNIPDYFIENEQEAYELDELKMDDMYLCMVNAMKEENIGWYYRKLLELKFIEQKTFKQISDTYSISLRTLKRDVENALEAVREHCKSLNN